MAHPPTSAEEGGTPTTNMTTRYTDEEWRGFITDTERNIRISELAYPCPKTESVAFARTIDHTLLKLNATRKQIDTLCAEARVANFATVCVRANHVAQAVTDLKGSPVHVASVVAFHQGTHDTYTKLTEARIAVEAGAHELDIVLNWPQLQKQQYNLIYNELALLRSIAPHPTVLKLILETSQLGTRDILAACTIASAANFDFVKTSTGFVGHGATEQHVRLMRAACEYLASQRLDGWKMKVKASGGIRTIEDAVRMLQAGADRLGSSGGVWIVKEGRDSAARGESPVSSGHKRKISRPGMSTRLFTEY